MKKKAKSGVKVSGGTKQIPRITGTATNPVRIDPVTKKVLGPSGDRPQTVPLRKKTTMKKGGKLKGKKSYGY